MSVLIRKLKLSDTKELANDIAHIWNTTYKGIVSDDLLVGISNNVDGSAKKLESKVADDINYYVLTIDEKIVGWLYFTYDTLEFENTAEIHSLYVLDDHHGKGYGKLLLNFAFSKIKDKGIDKVIIGCLDGNKSNEFYKHLGGKYIKSRLFREEYKENIYLFNI